MKKLRILFVILKRTKADHIILGFVAFLFLVAAVIQAVEPDINHYGTALWYCYAVISTAGFGDVVAVTFIGKFCSVLLTIYSLFVIAIATGVVVSFYGQIVEMQQKETMTMFMDKLEHLPELSKEELAAISEKVRKFR
ncbi:potassium channel family protein [Hespellia stercorisuis]|uniref:Voltage-gated potassium channel n=1 Tax=Hespellia stercorisuis DSM 15480 TaxID=1121950 RepID=A0A1M6MK02_9FIRM|nr:potassium channel family protein [Hespellia stercorisuis]SHJ83819.1 voltage-gated potassium channel [Hespellia stercorisuis DSM 15480]